MHVITMLLLCYYYVITQFTIWQCDKLTATRLNKRFPSLQSDTAPSSDLITAAVWSARRRSRPLFFFSSRSLFVSKKRRQTWQNAHRQRDKGAVIWTSARRRRLRHDGHFHFPAPAAVWPETVGDNHNSTESAHSSAPLPDSKCDSDGGRTQNPLLRLTCRGTFIGIVDVFENTVMQK